MLLETTADAYHLDRTRPVLAVILDRKAKTEPLETTDSTFDDGGSRVRDAQDAATVAAFRVEDACEEPLAPVYRRNEGPCHAPLYEFHVLASVCANSLNILSSGNGFLENEIVRDYFEVQQVACRSPERISIDERQTKLVHVSVGTTFPFILVVRKKPVSPHDPT